MLELRRISVCTCDHGIINRGIGCSSPDSLDLSPSYISDVMGSSTYIPHKQVMLSDACACQAYFVIKSCIDLGFQPRSAPESLDAKVMFPYASPYSGEISSMFGMKDITTIPKVGSSKGLIIYRNSSGCRFTDNLGRLLRHSLASCPNPKWWIVPVMRKEIAKHKSLLARFSNSKVALPIGSGRSSELLCLVGSRDHPTETTIWNDVTLSKLGWYNSYVRPMRVAPDICRDCWMILRYFNPRVVDK